MLRILAAEDSFPARLFLETVLAEYGRVDTAEDGVRTVELFRKALDEGDPYDLLVLDIMMPEMDGLSALSRIQELLEEAGVAEQGRPKVVMASCLTDREHMMRAHYECGADVYVTKPYTAQTLEETLSNLGLTPNPAPEP
jgi:two-component system chemotaxis response regulator CheY